MFDEIRPGIRYIYSRFIRERAEAAGLDHNDIAEMAQKRFALAAGRRPASSPAQGAYLEVLRRESVYQLSNGLLRDALLSSPKRIENLVRAAVLMHKKHDVPTGNINLKSMRMNVAISFGLAEYMRVLTGDDLSSMAALYERYNKQPQGRSNQYRALFRMINQRHEEMGLRPVDQFYLAP